MIDALQAERSHYYLLSHTGLWDAEGEEREPVLVGESDYRRLRGLIDAATKYAADSPELTYYIFGWSLWSGLSMVSVIHREGHDPVSTHTLRDIANLFHSALEPHIRDYICCTTAVQPLAVEGGAA